NVSVPKASEPGKCPSCGFVNNEGSKFCEECGTKLQ
ncbi:MAG: zinc-ribbon domain-containing protein, partial [Nitrosopumilaceae archaeon]